MGYAKIVWLVSSILFLVVCGVGCGGSECVKGTSQRCECSGGKQGIQVCQDNGTFPACQCNGEVEPTNEAPSTEAIRDNSLEPQTGTDAGESTAPEEGPVQKREQAPESEPVSETEPEQPVESNNPCEQGNVSWNGECKPLQEFCTQAFTTQDQASMLQPFQAILRDDGTAYFCKTKPGHYYLPAAGYGPCDQDSDGWIRIEAFRALNSTAPQVIQNARCQLRTINAWVYHSNQPNAKPQLQKLDKAVPLVETRRNDGGGKDIDRPVYTDNQQPLPSTQGSSCQSDTDCSAPTPTCYRGHCLKGRRFAPAELNTLTKACIKHIDLNDNQIGDATEQPGDSPTPKQEFTPLISGGYFVELHHGYYEKDYLVGGTKTNVYHIRERSRRKAPDQQGLALNCRQEATAFQPDYWRDCLLRDNQQCNDPNTGIRKKGLSACWMKDVKRHLPSLFKCVVFDGAKPADQSHFHPDNMGFAKNYSRTRCKFKAGLNETSKDRRDVQMECEQEPAKPDASKDEVGWACISFKPYPKTTDYLGGCIDETTEKSCGTDKVTYLKHEKESYGLTRAKRVCKAGLPKVCKEGAEICSKRKWLGCQACSHCPNQNDTQKKECPNQTWPECSKAYPPGALKEVCNGIDDDCNGQIDEGFPVNMYFKDADKDGFGDPKQVKVTCSANKPAGYILKGGDCNDNDKSHNPTTPELCNGKDENCNGKVDEACVTTVAGSGPTGLSNGAFKDGAATTVARFYNPDEIAVGPTGTLYIADNRNERIRLVRNGQVATVAGTTRGFKDGVALQAQFHGPKGVVVDKAGNKLYIVDQYNNRVRVVGLKGSGSGTISTVAGGSRSGYADGTGAAAKFSIPQGIAIGPAGNLYVADRGNNRIRKVTPSGVVTTVAGSGTAGTKDGPATSAQFRSPVAIAVDASGNIFVASSYASSIRKIDATTKQVTTFVGSSKRGSADGTGSQAQFFSVDGLAIGKSGNMYVADAGSVRVVSPSGVVTTLFRAGSGYKDGPGHLAKFSLMDGIAVDPTEKYLYIVELGNHRVRRVQLK